SRLTPHPASAHALFFTVARPTDTYTLSLHDALPICRLAVRRRGLLGSRHGRRGERGMTMPADQNEWFRCLNAGLPDDVARLKAAGYYEEAIGRDRKSTRLNSSHVSISYAVFCLKKKKQRT